MTKQYRFISTGGLGDSWIALLKIANIVEENKSSDFFVDWLHVESHDKIKETCEQMFRSLDDSKYKFTFECDPNYIQNYREGKWKDRQPIGSGMDAWCPLKGDDCVALTNPFAVSKIEREYDMLQPVDSISESVPFRYDVSIQVSAGAKNNRNWAFDPRHLAGILRSQGFKVALIGNDERFKDSNDEDNFVCSSFNIMDTTNIIRGSNLFIGLSGFLNYWACSMRVPNIHVIENEENEKRYYHQEWKKLSIGIRYPSMMEVNSAIKTMKNLGVIK